MGSGHKIYTKGGDLGQTSLLGGTRVSKSNQRVEAYGTVDELNSHIGLIRDQDIDEHMKKVLLEIQNRLFTLESILARDPQKDIQEKLPQLSEDDVFLLENEIDSMNLDLEPLSSFILAGGHPVVSYCHIARCVCRRAERVTIKLNEESPVDSLNIKYLNRLSDYLFILGRKLSKDFNAPETPWKPKV